VLDDKPDSLLSNNPSLPAVPAVTVPGWEHLFEVLWLATLDEARDFRDAFRTICLRSPAAVGERGVIPEILLFDYAMNEETVPVRSRVRAGMAGYQKGSPLFRLENPPGGMETVGPLHSVKPTSTEKADNDGCYGGGLLLEAFFGHPCVPVPTTRWGHAKTKGTEAAVFEWLLERDAGKEFEEKGRPEPKWTDVIPYALPRLRRRIAQLHDSRAVDLSWEDLSRLGNVKRLRMWSRFGLRKLPTDAIFLDYSDEDRTSEIKKWAAARLDSLLKRTVRMSEDMPRAREEPNEGMRMADEIWKVYDSDLPLRREDLALDEAAASEEEKQYFGLVATATGAKITKQVCTLETESEATSPRSIRWAVLFLVIRLYAHKVRALQEFQEHYAKTGFFFPRPVKEVTAKDVWLALFPNPSEYPANGDFSSKFGYLLRRLNSKDDRPEMPAAAGDRGNLCIAIEHLIDGKRWHVDPGVPKNQWTFGLIEGEEEILRTYARDRGLNGSDGSPFLNLIFKAHASL